MEVMISYPVIDCFSESLFRDHIRRVLQIKTLYLCFGSQENVFSCDALRGHFSLRAFASVPSIHQGSTAWQIHSECTNSLNFANLHQMDAGPQKSKRVQQRSNSRWRFLFKELPLLCCEAEVMMHVVACDAT
jgi:hypothetical protein